MIINNLLRILRHTPMGEDHDNIRNFMLHGWAGIKFDSAVLTKSVNSE
jgi:hypothetical protein